VEEGIGLLMKIKRSLNLKMFLGIFMTLMLTFLSAFIFMRIFLSAMYERAFSEQFSHLVMEFSQELLEQSSQAELLDIITLFSFNNHANVVLELGDEEMSVGSGTFSTEDSLVFSTISTRGSSGEMQTLTVAVSRQPIYRVIEAVQRTLIQPLFFTSLVAFIFSWVFAKRLTKPIIQISKISKKMQQLDLKARCHFNREDEIGVLAYNLNEMADKVESSLENLQASNLLLQEREKQQKEFFTAVSHELKTPLTILFTQLDGMIKNIGEYQDRDLYLKLARETTESMSDLISKLLSIAQMQSNVVEFKKSKVNFSKLVEKVCFDYLELANQRSVSLSYFCERDIEVLANENKLQLVLSNIYSNAIIHSPQQGLVDVQLETKDKYCILKFENYDSEIAEDDLKQIFEAFYRTDQSRSRYTGGSGLGLCIVKNVLDVHDDFEYNLENSENGVVFWIKIPLFSTYIVDKTLKSEYQH